MIARMSRFLGLVLVTALALTIAVAVTVSGWSRDVPSGTSQTTADMPVTPVAVTSVERERIEIFDTYSGMIRPFERFALGFELAGRVVALGTNAQGEPLDDGDRVRSGELLVQIDDRNFQAQLRTASAELKTGQAVWRTAVAQTKDAKARQEQAQSNMRRAEELRSRGGRAITDTEYQDYVTQLAVANAAVEQAAAQVEQAEAQVLRAQAAYDTARKNLEDTRLLSPVDATIARRLINVGESVNPQQTVMELIQIDTVLLIVGVPEAFVGHIRPGQKALVELLARDRYRHKRAEVEGQVRRVAEAADQTTGLFEVEIAVSNSEGHWKPGLIALGRIVIGEIEGHRVPVTSAVFRENGAYLFLVDGQGKAHRVDLKNWVEQDRDLVTSDLPPGRQTVVVRGQHRLIDGRPVKIVEIPGEEASEPITPQVRTSAHVADTAEP